MRVLVTGGTGFVGSHTARALLAAGHRVRLLARRPDRVDRIFGALAPRLEVVAGDMTDADAVAPALDDQDAVVHAAAVVALERRQAARVLADNLAGVERVVGMAAARGTGRILYVSSAAALFHPGATALHADAPVSELDTPYMRSKAACERVVRGLAAAGAPIRITYPGGVLGPDDPGLSEANRGLLALARLPVVTAGGMQIVDVRDVAAAHARLLDAPAGAGRHLLGGHFVPWATLVEHLHALTGRRRWRLPVPAPLLRAAGVACDWIKRVHPLALPLTHEAARIMTELPPMAVDPAGTALGVAFRDVRETLGDALAWLRAAGHAIG